MTTLGSTLSTVDIAKADLSDVSSSATPEIARLGFGGPAGSTARITLPATASLAGGIDFGGSASLQYVSAGKIKFERPSGGASIFDVNAATGQDSRVEFSENGTAQWRIRHASSDGDLWITDVVNSRNIFQIADDGTVIMGATPSSPNNGALWLSQSGGMDGTGGGSKIRLNLNQSGGFLNGVTVRPAAPTDTDTRSDQTNQSGGSFFYPANCGGTMAGFGSLVAYQTQLTHNKPTGATFPESYSEVANFVGGITNNTKGGFSENIEVNITNSATGDGGPAKVQSAIFVMVENNLYSTYNDTGIFGAGSSHLNGGMRGLHIQSGGTGYVGTGIVLRGTGGSSETSPVSGFKRALVLQDRSGTDVFCLDGHARMGFGITTNQATTLGARIVLGYTNAGAESTLAADGLLFGDDTTLYRSATDTLKTDDHFVAAGRVESAQHVMTSATNGTGYIRLPEQSSAITVPASNFAHIAVKGDKIVIAFNNGTSTQYLTCDLSHASPSSTWAVSTSAP